MRTAALVLLAAALCACEGELRPMQDDRPRPAPRVSDAAAERAAAAAVRDIEDRVARGDLPRVQFESNSDELLPASSPTLDLIAGVVLANPRLKLYVLAYADDAGDAAYNEELSRRRAGAVLTYLAKQGVPPPSMRFHGYGSSRPIATNDTEEGRAKNRRVEFRVTARGWESVY